MKPLSYCPRRREFAIYLAIVAVSVIAAYWAAERSIQHARDGIHRVACQDRRDAVRGWTRAAETRAATAQNPATEPEERRRAAAAAVVYLDVADGYRQRTIGCP